MHLRDFLAALLGGSATCCSASVVLPTTPVGLTCSAPDGAIVRLNLDLNSRRFQKEGFPSLPIEATSSRQILLMHHVSPSRIVSATIERNTMSYVARSVDKTSHERTETRYACTSGPVFEVTGAG